MDILRGWVIGLAAVSFWQGSTAQVPGGVQKPNAAALAEWRARVPEIQKLLEASDEQNCRGAPAPEIVDAFGSSKEGLSVALVDYCSGGAYTDSLIPMLLVEGKPAQARFRGANGKAIRVEFMSGASAMHSRFVELGAEQKAIYDRFTENDGAGKVASCGVKAYVWNAQSRTFDLDFRLSRTASADYCRRLRAKQ
ncbi:hypothetical protein [Occallatibacter savannae]|uniref:hypothetical protein n=1 Tax=Occallatibacter savannae TaxID=1002691 RepID=UPI000D6929DC|nr:hypothetical protein [Occallatibacter savannae]